jgi:hypothetical protein
MLYTAAIAQVRAVVPPPYSRPGQPALRTLIQESRHRSSHVCLIITLKSQLAHVNVRRRPGTRHDVSCIPQKARVPGGQGHRVAVGHASHMSFRIRLIIPRLGGYLAIPVRLGDLAHLHIPCSYSAVNGNLFCILHAAKAGLTTINSRGTFHARWLKGEVVNRAELQLPKASYASMPVLYCSIRIDLDHVPAFVFVMLMQLDGVAFGRWGCDISQI